MKRYSILRATLAAAVFFIFCCFTPGKADKMTAAKSFSGNGEIPLKHMEQDILALVNRHRRSIGLNSLQLSVAESRVAARHSFNMASGVVPFGHQDLKKRMELIASQVGYISMTGENVAFGQMDAREVVAGWLNSPGHKRNIEGDFTLTGIGIAKDSKGMIYYTQIFTR